MSNLARQSFKYRKDFAKKPKTKSSKSLNRRSPSSPLDADIQSLIGPISVMEKHIDKNFILYDKPQTSVNRSQFSRSKTEIEPYQQMIQDLSSSGFRHKNLPCFVETLYKSHFMKFEDFRIVLRFDLRKHSMKLKERILKSTKTGKDPRLIIMESRADHRNRESKLFGIFLYDARDFSHQENFLFSLTHNTIHPVKPRGPLWFSNPRKFLTNPKEVTKYIFEGLVS